MEKRILIISPKVREGAPAFERVRSFGRFFESRGIKADYYCISGKINILSMINFIIRKKYKNVFLTMPPFRLWMLCFLPGRRVVLDIRDGWSIAMRTGYGGTTRPRQLKSYIARAIEQFSITFSDLTITCTPGLTRYHSTYLTERKIAFIPNGLPEEYYNYVSNMNTYREDVCRGNIKIFICAGKFSEYGKEKVVKVLNLISKRYYEFDCRIELYGADMRANEWVHEYIRKSGINNITVIIKGSLDKYELLDKIMKSDYGISIIRDEAYDFGTKIYEYIACGIPVFDYFTESDIKEYFGGCFDTDYNPAVAKLKAKEFVRERILAQSAKLQQWLDERFGF